MNFDVIIVGGGPIGSNLAYNLSKNNLSVCLIEQKKIVGIPLQCAGIVSKDILNYVDIPNDLIINKVKGAFLHSPNNNLKVFKEESTGLIIDRVKFDQYLFNKAINSELIFKRNKVVNVDSSKSSVELDNGEIISAKIIVGADGFNSIISKSIGNEVETLNASQFLVEIRSEEMKKFRKKKKESINDYIDVIVRSDLLPGFIWIIPSEKNSYRVGLFSNKDFEYQNKILIDFLNNNFSSNNFKILQKYNGFIPKFNSNAKLYHNNFLLVGDSTSILKPTTGGGIVLGFIGSQIATDYILKAIKENNIDLLENYSLKFRNKCFKELDYQFKFQKTLNKCSDNDFDYIFEKLKENDCENLISKYGDIDKQSILIKEFFKRGLFFKILPSFFVKKFLNIWNFENKE